MSFIPTPNSASLCFDFTTAGQNWQFCFTIRKSAGSISPTDLDQITSDAQDSWTSDLKALINNATTLRQIRSTDLQTQGGPVDINAIAEAGTGGATPLINNVALVLSGRSALRGRSYRSRAYIGGLPSAAQSTAVDAGTGFTGAIVDWAEALQAALDGHGYDMVVRSTQHNKVETNPAATNEIIAWVVDPHFDSQRKRLAGRGT